MSFNVGFVDDSVRRRRRRRRFVSGLKVKYKLLSISELSIGYVTM